MSEIIDEKVVKMQFDNRQFEEGVNDTILSLAKLKDSLNMNGAEKGLLDFSKATSSIGSSALDGLANSTKNLSGIFSNFIENVAIGGVRKLGEQIETKIVASLNKIPSLIKNLSFDQVSAGFKKYSDKTTSVATLVAQGYDLETVNEQLDKLNWYTDETSYNFVDMVSNIGKFTASGQKLDDSVTAMQGIANWAAVSGQNAATASRAMFQLSQAMSAGVMRKEEWKSIQNANMSTAEFKQNAIDAGVALGTLKKNADGTYTSLVGKSSAFSATSKFEDNLTEGLWFTNDVMMEVFKNYSSAVQEIYDYTEEYGVTASEAIAELGDNLDEFGLKAFRAAQEARTFEDVLESVKDAVSTKWMNTFELIIGDEQEAVNLFTYLANALYDVFASSGDERNELLKEWKQLGGREKLLRGFANVIENLGNIVNSVKTAFRDIFPKSTAENIMSITDSFYDFTKSIKLTDEQLTNIYIAAKGYFEYLRLYKSFIVSLTKTLFPSLMKGVNGLVDVVLRYLAIFGILLSKVATFIRNGHYIEKVINVISVGIQAIKVALLLLLSTIVTVINKIKNSEKIASIFTKIANVIVGAVIGAIAILYSAIVKIKTIFSELKNLGTLSKVKTSVLNFLTVTNGLLKTIATTLTGVIFVALSMIGKVLKKVLENDKIVFIIDKLSRGLLVLSNVLLWTKEKLTEFFNSLTLEKVIFLGFSIAIFVGLLKIISGIKSLLSLKNNIVGLINAFKAVPDAIVKTTNGFSDFLKTFSLFPKQSIDVIGYITKIATAIALVAGSFYLLSKIPTDKLAQTLLVFGSLILIFTAYAGIMTALSYAQKKGEFATKAMYGTTIQLLSVVSVLALIVKQTGTLTRQQVHNGINVVLACSILMISIYALSKFISSFKVDVKITDYISLFAMFTLIAEISVILYALKNLKFSAMISTVAGIGLVLSEIIGTLYIVKKLEKKIDVNLDTLITLYLFGIIISKVAKALEIASKHNWKHILASATGIGIVLIAMSGALKILSKIDYKNALAASAGILIMSFALGVIADAFSKLQNINFEKIESSLWSLVVLAGIFAGLSVVGTLGDGIGALAELAVSGAIVILAAGLKILASAFSELVPTMLLLEGKDLLSVSICLLEILVPIVALSASGPLLIIFALAMKVLSLAALDLANALAIVLTSIVSTGGENIAENLDSMTSALLRFSVACSIFAKSMIGISIPSVLFGAALYLGGKGIKFFAEGINILSSALIKLKTANLPSIISSITSVVTVITTAIAGTTALSAALILIAPGLLAISLPLITFSIALSILAKGLLLFGTSIAVGSLGIFIFAAALKILEKVDFYKIAEGIDASFKQLLEIVILTTLFSSSADKIAKAILLIGGAIALFGIAVVSSAIGFAIGVVAIKLLVSSLKEILSIDPLKIAEYLLSLTLSLAAISLVGYSLIGGSIGLLLASVAILALSKSLENIVNLGDSSRILIEVSNGLLRISLISGLMGKSVISILAFSAGLYVLSFAMSKLEGVFSLFIEDIAQLSRSMLMLEQVGVYACQGLSNGVLSGLKLVSKAFGLMGLTGLESLMASLDEHSPSKETEKVGYNADLGAVNGIAKGIPLVQKMAATLGLSVVETTDDVMAKGGEASGKDLTTGAAKGIEESKSKTNAAASNAGSEAGASFVEKLIAVISSSWSWISDQLNELGISVPNPFEMFDSGGVIEEIKSADKQVNEYSKSLLEATSLENELFGTTKKEYANATMMSYIENEFKGQDRSSAKIANEMKKRGYKYDAKQKKWYTEVHTKGLFDNSSSFSSILDDLTGDMDGLTASMDGTNSKAKSLNETIEDSINIFERFKDIESNTSLTGNKLIGNMKSQIDMSEKWATSLSSLKGKISSNLYDSLLEQGTDSYEKVVELMDMSSAQLYYASELYDRKTKDSLKYSLELRNGLSSESSAYTMTAKQMEVYNEQLSKYAYKIVDVEEGTDITKAQIDAMSASILATNPSLKLMGKTLDDVSIDILALATDITTMQDDIKDSLEGSMKLFENYSQSFSKTPEELQRSLNTQVAAMSSWSNDMAILAKRGLSEGLLKELREMGVSGADTVRAFVNMTDEQLKAYNESWVEAQGKPEEFAKVLSLAMHGAEVTMNDTIEGMSADLYLLKCNVEDTIKSSMDAFSEFNLTDTTSIKQMTKDLLSNLKGTADFAVGMNNLANKGIDEGLLKSLREAGPKSVKYIKALNEADKRELDNYNKLWEIQSKDWSSILATLVATGDAESLKLAETVSKNLEKIGDATFKTMSEVQEELKSSISSSIKMFEAYDSDFDLTPEKALENVKSQVEGIKQWSSNLQSLAGKNISNEFLDYLTSLGPEGAETINAIVQMSASELAETDKYVQEALKLDETESAKIAESYKKSGRYFSDGIIEGLDLNAIYKAYNAAGGEGLKGYNDSLGIHSPSTMAIESSHFFIEGIVSGLKDSKPAEKSASNLGGKVSASARSVMSVTKGEDIGKNLIRGIVQGMNKQAQTATASVTTIMNNLTRIARKTLGIESPSKVFAEIGMYTVLGMEEGLKEYSDRVYKASSDLGIKATEGFDESFKGVSAIIDWDDLNPVITPTLDITDIINGVRDIGSLFDSNKTIKANMDLGNQNGTSGIGGQTFIQNNYSPKALSRVDLYRQTKNLFSTTKGLALG